MEPVNTSKPAGRRFTQRQYQAVIFGVGALFAIGTLMWGFGVFKSEPKTAEQAEGNQTGALAVPEAKNQALEVNKYKRADQNDPRFKDKTEVSDPGVGFVVGAERSDRQTSNENLNAEDYNAVTEAGRQTTLTTAAQRKRDSYAQQQNRLRTTERENARLANPSTAVFRKSPRDIEDERREREDREINQRTANLLLDKMDKANTAPNTGQLAAPALGSGTRAAEGTPSAQNAAAAQSETVMHGEVSRNTIGQPNDKVGFFYNMSRKNTRRSYTANDAIQAVIHGMGPDDIAVRDGTTAKIRLEQNTVFQVEGNDIILEKGTLLNGICKIGADRVYISVNSLVIGDAIYPIEVQAFDLDGQQGVYVPDLAQKNQVSRRLTQAASQPLSGGSYFVGQGNVGQQVGTQVAVQGARQVMSAGRQVITAKAQNPKVTIRTNYKILLKSAKLVPTSSTNSDYEGN